MKWNIALVSLAGLFVSSSAMAEGYGPAGCGLGSLLFEPNSGMFMQVLAATTNGTFGSQTFGITSGTSNCDGSAGGTASAKKFVATNRAAIAKDIARGQGETIESVASLAGCADPAAVGAALQQNFSSIFPDANVSDTQVGDNVVHLLSSDKTLACGNLG